MPRSRWHVSMSDPGIASIDPRTRAPVSVKSTSSAQPRSRITCFPASSGSSPSGRLRVTSSAKTIPSRKNSPWQAYDITLSYNFRIESSSCCETFTERGTGSHEPGNGL